MKNYINKTFSYEDSPKPGIKWQGLGGEERKKLVLELISKNPKYETFEISRAEENGSVTLKIEKSIQASERGILLLDLEELLKNNIDQGITIWLEPVGDKSKLRNLRGIEIKS